MGHEIISLNAKHISNFRKFYIAQNNPQSKGKEPTNSAKGEQWINTYGGKCSAFFSRQRSVGNNGSLSCFYATVLSFLYGDHHEEMTF